MQILHNAWMAVGRAIQGAVAEELLLSLQGVNEDFEHRPAQPLMAVAQ